MFRPGGTTPLVTPAQALVDAQIFSKVLVTLNPSPACGVEPQSGSTRDPRPQGRGRVRDGADIRQSLTLPIPSGWAPSLSRKAGEGLIAIGGGAKMTIAMSAERRHFG